MNDTLNETRIELTEARASIARALSNLFVAEAKLNAMAAQIDLALLRLPDEEEQ